MGKYSNVDVSQTLQIVNSLYTVANCEKDEITATFSNYKSNSVKNITKAISKVLGNGCTGSIGNLKDKLNNLKEVCNKINEYKNIESNINILRPKQTYYEYIRYTGEEATKHSRSGYYEERVNYDIQNQIIELERKLKRLEKEIDNLL